MTWHAAELLELRDEYLLARVSSWIQDDSDEQQVDRAGRRNLS